MPYLDFQHIKEAVKIETAAHALQLTMSKSGAQMRGACPACKAGGDRALAVNTDKQSFYCFASRAGGDVIGLTAHVQGLAQKDAALWLHNRFLEQVPASAGTVSTVPAEGTVPNSSPQPPSPGMPPLDYLEADHPAVEAIGFDTATASALGIGFAGKGVMRGLVAVPVRLPDGTLAGYLGITEARLPNRWHLGENVVPMKKSA
jgi:hypothetical protein